MTKLITDAPEASRAENTVMWLNTIQMMNEALLIDVGSRAAGEYGGKIISQGTGRVKRDKIRLPVRICRAN